MLQRGMIFSLLWAACQCTAFGINHRAERSPSASPVIGGTAATEEEFPFVVLILLLEGHCSGSIIDPLWILTAAHCFATNQSAEYIIAGPTSSKTFMQNVSVARVFIHPNYHETEWGALSNDLALVKLQKPLEFNRFVSSTQLPTANSYWYGFGRIIGWGRTWYDELPTEPHYISLYVQDERECRKRFAYRNMDGSSIPKNSLCYVSLSDTITAPCQGDSGGPLIDNQDRRGRKIVGVVSTGSISCGEDELPWALFVQVSFYTQWIQETLKNEGSGHNEESHTSFISGDH